MKKLFYFCMFCFQYLFYAGANEIVLAQAMKSYLEQRISGLPESEIVTSLDINKLKELKYRMTWCQECWLLQKIDLEQILYKFYLVGKCPNNKNMLMFLNFCLDCYEKLKEKTEYPPDSKGLLMLQQERLRIYGICKKL